MNIINIEEIRESDRLKKEKCNEDHKAFDDIMGKALKGVVLKRKDSG